MRGNQTIQLDGVSKSFGNKTVLHDIHFTAVQGEVVGLVGANGCGKTTLLRLTAGLMYPNSGNITVFGQKICPGWIGQLPESIGILIETPGFLPNLSGMRNLCLLAEIRGNIDKRYIAKVMEKVGLDPSNRKGVRSYSLGMRQRLGIAQAIMESPRILLLDEPTNSLDQATVQTFRAIIRDMRNDGVTIVLASHAQEEISALCDRVIMFSDGQLLSTSPTKSRGNVPNDYI